MYTPNPFVEANILLCLSEPETVEDGLSMIQDLLPGALEHLRATAADLNRQCFLEQRRRKAVASTVEDLRHADQ